MDLSIIIVSWNVRELLRRCLASVEASLQGRPDLEGEVFVVDNASADASVQMVAAEFPQVHLVANAENRGFAAANNQAMAASRGRYLLLLNPDTEVVGGALGTMVDYLETNPEVGVVGPKLLNADGSLQSSRRRFPTMATALVESTILQRYFPRAGLLRRYYCLDQDDDEVQDVDWLVGACLMVRRRAMEQVGPMDDQFFLYSEELDWCRRIRGAGWRVAYLPKARVVHHYGQSSAQDMPQRHIRFQDSKCRYFAKYHGRVAGALLRWFILGTYVFQMAEEGAKFLLRHKPQLRRQRLGLLYRVVRSGLRP